MKFFTCGYAGRTAEELKNKAEELNALVIDIRFSPWSWRPEWRKQALADLLGDRYLFNKDWGNKNYNTEKPIELVDFREGKARMMRAYLASNADNILLFCGCQFYSTCHRSVIAELLRAEGEEVEELIW